MGSGRSLTNREAQRARLTVLAGRAGLVLLGILAVFTLSDLAGVLPEDFRVYLGAATKIADGESPYPSLDDWDEVKGKAYVYPPLIAYLVLPFTLVPAEVADYLVKALLVVGVVAIMLVLRVRDWRCYLVAFMWAPVISAVGNGQVTIPLALAAALVWRYRARPMVAGLSLGVSIAAKLLLWPLWVWLAVSRRHRATAIASLAAALLIVLPWAAIGFAGLGEYPDLLQREREFAQSHSYAPFAVAEDLGADEGFAWTLAIVFASGLLVASIISTSRGQDVRGFVLAIGTALAFTPVVWLHYFALLLVPVAIVRPRLSPLWFVPLAMWAVAPAIGSDTPYKTGVTVSLCFLTVVLAARAAPGGARLAGITVLPAGGRP